MTVIYKYLLRIEDEQTIEMPAGADILTAQYQGRDLMLWAIVEPDSTPSPRTIHIVGTGQPFGRYLGQYLATVQDPYTQLVWHVFYE